MPTAESNPSSDLKKEDRPLVESEADRAAEAAPGDRKPGEDLAKRQDQLLDEALEESFPGSDPVTPSRITGAE